MLREALSSLLLLCLVGGCWLARVAVGAFVTSVRNQAKQSWILHPTFNACSEIQETGRKETPFSIKQERKRQTKQPTIPCCDGARSGDKRRQSTKRSLLLAFEVPEILIDRPTKRCKQGSRKAWRFWLPQSSDLDKEELDLIPFAGIPAQIGEPGIIQSRRCDQEIKSFPIGGGISPGTPIGVDFGFRHYKNKGDFSVVYRTSTASAIPFGDGASVIPPAQTKQVPRFRSRIPKKPADDSCGGADGADDRRGLGGLKIRWVDREALRPKSLI
ncbi:unnamed protein product [Linum trigynum]|uniref:Uncharacterized protein n=1 Tax=Linum trigynum TaxID=586398 RepID=A0AAV2GMH6_9ROSI